MLVRFLIPLILCFLAVSAPADGQKTYYVASGGDNRTGNGSSEKPWATIGWAVQRIPDEGATIIVHDGIYHGVTRISRKFSQPVIIRAEHPYKAHLENDKGVTLTIAGAANVEVAGFEISRAVPPPEARGQPLLAHIARSSAITLRNNILRDSRNNDLLKINEESNGIVILGNTFHNQQGVAGQHIDINGCHNVFVLENIFFNHFGQDRATAAETHGFIVVKNSGGVPESRRTQISSNIFLNFEGSSGSNFVMIGEDAKPFHEAQEVLIENNLLIGNSPDKIRAPLGVKGGRNILFRNNTVTGDLPGRAYAMRLNREGANPVNLALTFINNVWSDPAGTMGLFSDGRPEESNGVKLENNAYWNGGRELPRGSVVSPASDTRALRVDPRLPWKSPVVLPEWTGDSFRSGTKSIRGEFERLVKEYGVPGGNSPLAGKAEPEAAPRADILGALRGARPALGAAEPDSASPPLRMWLLPGRVTGDTTTALGRVLLERPAPAGGVTVGLSSSLPSLASPPSKISIPAGDDSVVFPIKTAAVEEQKNVTFTASSGENKTEAVLELAPQGISTVNPSAFKVWAGNSNHLLMLEGPGSADLKIEMSSSRPDLVSFPEVQPVPGRAFARFVLHSKPVSEETPVTITAAIGNTRQTANVAIRPGLAVTSLKLSRTHAFNGASAEVTIFVSAPTSPLIRLESENPAALIVPESVRVPPGELSVTVPVQTRPIPGRKGIGIRAITEANQRTIWLVVGSVEARSLSLQKPRGNTSAGILYVTVPAVPDVRCELTSSNPAMAAVPDSIEIPEGTVRVQFPIKLSPDFDPESVTVSAACGGVTKTARFPGR